MAYSTDVQDFAIFGNFKGTWGLVTADGTTGTIDVELSMCLGLALTPVTAAKVVNITSTLPIAGSAVGCGAESNTDFYFIAIGY